MEALVYGVLWVAAMFLMMRLGCGSHTLGHAGHRKKEGSPPSDETDGLRWVPPPKDTDPVCGTVVRPQEAKSSVHDGTVHYFCSRECREVFEATPHTYATDRRSAGHRQLELTDA